MSINLRSTRRLRGNGGWSAFRIPFTFLAVLGLSAAVVAGDSMRRGHNATVALPDTPATVRARTRFPWLWPAAVCCVSVAFFLVYWFSFPRELGERPVFNSPRESIAYYLAERAVDGHGFSAPIQHFDELPRDIALALTPRDSANLDGEIVPQDFAGTMVIYTAAMRVHPSLVLFITPLFAVFSALVLMRITQELFGRGAAFVALVSWLVFPPLWITGSWIVVSDLPALAFLLCAVLMFIRYWREPDSERALLMGAFFGLSVVFRYPNVMLAAPFFLALLFGRRIELAHLFAAAAAFVPIAASVLVFNELVYGDPLTTGFHLGKELIAETVNFSRESFFKRRPDVPLRYLRLYGLVPVIVLPVAASLGATIWFAMRGRGFERVFALITLGMFAILAAYYGQQDAWGYASAQLNASVLRYLLPGFALLFVFGAGMASRAADRWGWGVYALPALLFVAAIWQVQTAPGGVREVHQAIDRSTEVREEIVAKTEPDAVIASRIMDKVIFPHRQTLTLTFAIHNEQPLDKGDLETWEHFAGPERFAEVAAEMEARRIPFYFLNDPRIGPLEPYQQALLARGLTFERVTTTRGSLFRIDPVAAP
jgi:hypothetical protein